MGNVRAKRSEGGDFPRGQRLETSWQGGGDYDDGGDDDIYIMMKCMSVAFLLTFFYPPSLCWDKLHAGRRPAMEGTMAR